jgi:hypothetical protein
MGKSGKQAEATAKIRELLLQRGFDIPSRKMTLPDDQQWTVLGAALGRIAILDKPVRTGKRFCPHRTDVHRIASMSGHEIKLVRETGET